MVTLGSREIGEKVGTVVRKKDGKTITSSVYRDSEGKTTYVADKVERTRDVEQQRVSVSKVKSGQAITKKELTQLQKAGLVETTNGNAVLTSEPTGKAGVTLKAQEQTQTTRLTGFEGENIRDPKSTFTVQTQTTGKFVGQPVQTTTQNLTREQLQRQQPELYTQFIRTASKQTVSGTIRRSGSVVGIGPSGERLEVVTKTVPQEQKKEGLPVGVLTAGKDRPGVIESLKTGFISTLKDPTILQQRVRGTKIDSPEEAAFQIGSVFAYPGVLASGAVLQGSALVPTSFATSVGVAYAAPKVGQFVSTATLTKEQKQFLKTGAAKEAIQYGLIESSKKVSEATTIRSVFSALIKGDTKKAGKEALGEVRAFGEKLTILAGDKSAFAEGAKTYAESTGTILTPTQEQALIRARFGRGVGEITGAITIGALSERLGQRLVAKEFVKTGGKVLVGDAPLSIGFRAAKAIAPAGAQEGLSMYVLETQTRGFKPTAQGAALSTVGGAATAGVFGGIIAGSAFSRKATSRFKGNLLNIGLNIADPYEKLGDITYDVASTQLARRFRVPIITATVTKTKTGVQLGADTIVSSKTKAPTKTQSQTIIKEDTNQFELAGFTPVQAQTLTSVNIKPSVLVGAFVPVQTQTTVTSPAQTQTQTQTPAQVITPVETPAQVTTKTNVPVTTFDDPFVLPIVPFFPGGSSGRKGRSKRGKTKLIGESETLFRVFTGRAKQLKKGLFGVRKIGF